MWKIICWSDEVCYVTTSYFCTKWRLFINFLDCTHILYSQWYDSHIMFCMLYGSYCCFPFSPNMFWCWVETLFYLRKLSPEVKLIHFALLCHIGPTWSIASRLFLQALPWPLTKFLPLSQLPPVILLQLFLGPPLYIVFEDSNSDLLFCGRRILPQCMCNPLIFLHPAEVRRECMFSFNLLEHTAGCETAEPSMPLLLILVFCR
jgi:hypothetical protein